MNLEEQCDQLEEESRRLQGWFHQQELEHQRWQRRTRMTLLEQLKQPFPAHKIHWRVGATNGDKTQGIALAYLDARDVMERLDEACDMGGWQCRYPFPGCCEIGVRIGVNQDTGEECWIWKANGAGTTQVEAEKGQFSDAFKRAAVMFGVGRYLYDLPNVWMPLENKRFSPETQKKLAERLASWQEKYFNQEKAA